MAKEKLNTGFDSPWTKAEDTETVQQAEPPMEFIKATERTEYASVGESLVGIYHLHGGREVVLIDAGAVEKQEFLDGLLQRGLEVKALLCTHLHFDHISSAGLVWEKFHMPSYAHYLEEKEPKFPVREFPVTKLYEFDSIVIDGEEFKIIHTPGHTDGHLSFVTPDGVCCVGDTFMSQKPLQYSKLPYMIDVEESIQSMELIRQTDYPAYLLSHESLETREGLDSLIDANIDKELELYRMIKEFVTEPMDIEEMMTGFMKLCGIRSNFILNDHGYRDTIRSRVVSLDYAGELRFDGNIVRPI